MKWIAAIKLIFTLDCRHATPLVSREMDGPLPRSHRVAIRLHLLICKSCRRARRQFRFMRNQLHELFRTTTPGRYESVALSDQARRKIAEALQSADDDTDATSRG